MIIAIHYQPTLALTKLLTLTVLIQFQVLGKRTKNMKMIGTL